MNSGIFLRTSFLQNTSGRLLKGCVRYIFASLFCMSKREHLQKKEKCFLSHFKSSSRSCDNQLFNIFDIRMSWRHQMPKHETRNISLNNLESKRSLVMKFGQFMQYYKIIFIKKFYKKCGLGTSSRPFLIFKEISVKKIL